MAYQALRERMTADTAIFLGAGASKAEGAPLQGELFKAYFSSADFRDSRDEMDRELAAFFGRIFSINVRRARLTNDDFPIFEEVLGLTDLAIMRKEGFTQYEISNGAKNGGRLQAVAQDLVFLVAKVLDAQLGTRGVHHRKLVRTLRDGTDLRRLVFVSTNYDILIDNALTEEHGRVDLDYGVELRNFNRPNDWTRPQPERSVLLCKPHGSLNWLYCPTCNELELTPKEKGVITRLISKTADKECPECGSTFSPMIVPPTFYKDLNNAFLSSIWNRTDVALRKVKHIIFCGYSFPDADIHIKYLLKRAQVNRTGDLRVTVVNNYPGKDPRIIEQERARYRRFLGEGVDYTDLSFEQFAADPMKSLSSIQTTL